MEDFDCRKVRNICILAHVDHGKTTLADHLIASFGGGVLHPKQAGRLRFMDYLDEEQRRAITMKSACISLRYQNYVINLIDSPGHIDFCSEVSTAARQSDGALVLVDAVEGVHIQTRAVLRQAWIEKLTPCLVLNKIDRLIAELKLTPLEAYNRLLRIVHEVNSIMSAYKSEKYLSNVDSILTTSSEVSNEEEDDNDEDTFQPQKGNVAFTCSLDGWGFTVKDFAEMYASKLGASESALRKSLWGPRYFNSKTKMIVGKKGVSGLSKARPMFVQFVLEPLWEVYCGDRAMVEKAVKSFNLAVPARELQSKDSKVVLQSVMSRWLPLSNAILSMVINCLPDPIYAQSYRISRLIPTDEDLRIAEGGVTGRKAVENCDSASDAPSIAFVSKMFAVPVKILPSNDYDDDDDDGDGCDGECFLAFTRVFSGVIYSGQKVFVLYAERSERDSQEAELGSIYLMMGQGLKRVRTAKAGSIVAIKGLGKKVLKSATLSTTRNCRPFSSMSFQVAPMLRVAIAPALPADMSTLAKGLRLLNRADPFVEVSVSSRGEHVLAVAGEVHLERCVKDLRERFAKIKLEVLPPLVSYKETIDGEMANLEENVKFVGEEANAVVKRILNGRCSIRVQVIKLPPLLTKLLEENSELLASLIKSASLDDGNSLEMLKSRMLDAAESGMFMQEMILKRIWALGPNHIGPNILLVSDLEEDCDDDLIFHLRGSPHVSQKLGFLDESDAGVGESEEAERLASSIVSGFQIATAAGPLCDEPMWGLGFLVDARVARLDEESYHMLTGQVMAAVKDACRAAVLQRKPRLVEAMYFCELITPTEYLGAMYAVLGRRRARILKEEMQEGSPLFTVHAYVPVAESFGFADELRRRTSGASSALLVLSHWELLAQDPFFVPKTDEEMEEFGDGSSVLPNTARKLINAVRRHKGLPLEEKVVKHATKQRTLARKV